VNYISHGVGKGEAAAEPSEVKGAEERQARKRARRRTASALKQLLRQPQREGQATARSIR
jgi:ATP-dependent Clp protease ATP-binding subunit ClpA